MSSTNNNRMDAAIKEGGVESPNGNIDLAHVHNDINSPVVQLSGRTTPEPLGGPWPQPVIVLDPGHSGKDIEDRDTKTGLHDHDYPNFPEINEAWDITQKVAAQLRKDGYKVVLTKDSALDSASLRERAEIAKHSHADLAVSIHDDHGKTFDKFAQVYAQEPGEWRGGTAAHPQDVFTNRAIAAKSRAAAENFVSERERAEGRPVDLTRVNFANRPGIDAGNISQVQLYAGELPTAKDPTARPVPWVYNEVGGGTKLDAKQEDAYASGMIAAIEKSVPRR